MKTSFIVLIALLSFPLTAGAAGKPKDDTLAGWKYLEGTWTGVGEGKPGESVGTATFSMDLDNKVVVRKNRTEFPATKDRPASVHEDLMIVYRDATQGLKAIYFDNEGHVINYDAGAAADGTSWTFTSHPAPSAPRFRLTYRKVDGDTVSTTFEIAPPGREFGVYLKGTSRRATAR